MKIAGSGSIGQRHGSTAPDPHQNVMDPATLLKTRQKFILLCSVVDLDTDPELLAGSELNLKKNTLTNQL